MTMSPTKSCMVCGDKALGYNFNAVTCESCKAFFRRNALAKKQFTCPFNQNCEITVVTRRFCQKCRLKKCIGIGMKSENIMSEEDKLIKRRKIETNRAKRKEHQHPIGDNAIKPEAKVAADSSGIVVSDTYDSQSCSSFESVRGGSNNDCGIVSAASVDHLASVVEVSAFSMTGAEIVEFIVCDPDRATEAINKLMRNPTEALFTIEKVINSPSDALRLISHLISYPGNALKIISKIMNSPFDALTVFTKFMSSPTDAIEIISKIVSSPQDVLAFVKQLMDSPEDALDIMNKFMDTPAEALRIINKMVNGSNSSQPVTLEDSTFPVSYTDMRTSQPFSDGANALIHSMLIKSPISAENESLPVPASIHIEQAPAVSPSSPRFDSPSNFRSELSSTSGGIIVDTDLSAENFDITKFIQNSSPDNAESINSLDSVLTKVICIEYQSFNALSQETRIKQEHGQMKQHCLPTEQQIQQPVCAPSSITMGRDLNEAELLKLRELKIASEALYYPVDEDLNELVTDDVGIKSEGTHQDPKLLQVINLTAVAIKRLIKMAKKITAFRDLCQEDQVAVLKGGCIEMMIMRSVMTYDDNRNAWKIPHTKEGMSNIRADVLKLAKGNVYEEHLRFIRTFDEKWRMDENIILIMCAIILLTPSRPRVIHSDVIRLEQVRLEQNSYYYLLRRYLESIYPGCEAKSALIKLIQKISDVEHLNQFMIGVYLNVNPSQVEPLLREIFDMKNH